MWARWKDTKLQRMRQKSVFMVKNINDKKCINIQGCKKYLTCQYVPVHFYRPVWVLAPGIVATCAGALERATPAELGLPAAHRDDCKAKEALSSRQTFTSTSALGSNLSTHQASTKEPPSPLTGDSISISNSQWSLRGSLLSCTRKSHMEYGMSNRKLTDGSKDIMDTNKAKAYTGCGNAGAPVCISFYCDVGQGSTKQWTQQLPKAVNLLKT